MTRRKREINKSATLSAKDLTIPLASASDKLQEARYFLHELVRNYHYPDEFRYSLSAFFQAARSTTDMVRAELKHRTGFKDWWDTLENSIQRDVELMQLIDFRDTTVHISSLIPSSDMFAGHFKYGRPKAGFEMPLSPAIPTVEAFFGSRRIMAAQEHPHRIWAGEECGIQRTWRLKEIPNRELVEFCTSCFNKYARVLEETHDWLGVKFQAVVEREPAGSDYRNLRESDIFVEVAAAWDATPSALVIPNEKPLHLPADPGDDSEVLHSIAPGSRVAGWVGEPSPYWDSRFISMLIYSVDGNVIEKDTAAFFKLSDAAVQKIEDDNVEGDDGEP
jgi:hypothetical protein